MTSARPNSPLRVVALSAPNSGSEVPAFEDTLRHCVNQPDCRVLLIDVAQSVELGLAPASRLAAWFNSSPKITVVSLDGKYGSVGMSLASGADIVIASDETSVEIEAAELGYNDSWFPNLSLRHLKWLTFGAGALNAEMLKRCGFLNFTYPRSEFGMRRTEVANRIARVPADLLALKKRAHDTRHRLSLGNHGR